MNKQFVNPFSKSQTSTNDRKTLSAKDFFAPQSEGGYDSKEDFLVRGESSRSDDIQSLQKFIDYCNVGMKITSKGLVKIDKGNNPYRYVEFISDGGNRDGAKLVLVGPWERILNEVHSGRIRLKFSLNELIAEARNA